jgi:hypothetical protein
MPKIEASPVLNNSEPLEEITQAIATASSIH